MNKKKALYNIPPPLLGNQKIRRFGRFFADVFEPSLVRRLVFAQMALLFVLWTVVLSAIIWSARNGDGLLDSEIAFDAALAVAGDLNDRPEQQLHSLQKIDHVFHDGFLAGANSNELGPTLLVWRGSSLIYRSAGGAAPIIVEASKHVQQVSVQNKSWLARSRREGDLLVTFLIPDTYQLIVTMSSRGYYLLPLVISLPFLLFPAWAAVRVAMQPWKILSSEIAARGPGNLSELKPAPTYRELRSLVGALNGLLNQLSASSARERNLIGDAAHQLRTPLAAMQVGIEALERHSVPSELKTHLVRVSERASRLVDQLLRLMRSEAAPDATGGDVAIIDVDDVVRERLAIVDTLAHAKGVELEFESTAELFVRGEREGLEALIDNLMENAIKYSSASTVIKVILESSASVVRLSVKDRGPGIEEQWRERVFDRFFRAPDQFQSGSGLGLAIVRAVVLRHQGSVTLSNRRGGGLCVQVELPRHPLCSQP